MDEMTQIQINSQVRYVYFFFLLFYLNGEAYGLWPTGVRQFMIVVTIFFCLTFYFDFCTTKKQNNREQNKTNIWDKGENK